jgi:hypothetical protein
MGGQNHQPTSSIRLIGPSAFLSQKLGEGFAAVLNSNNELENAIIAAVDKLHVESYAADVCKSPSEYLTRTIAHLEASIGKIDDIQLAYKRLLIAAEAEGYTGNPLASNLEKFKLAQQFSGTLVLPSVNLEAWTPVEKRAAEFNILSTLEWESSEFDRLREPTAQLIAVVRDCQALLDRDGKRSFIEAVEWNKLPLRQSYGRVFSLWNHLHAMFLYSALMMTELFYRANGFPGLLDTDSKGSRRVA